MTSNKDNFSGDSNVDAGLGTWFWKTLLSTAPDDDAFIKTIPPSVPTISAAKGIHCRELTTKMSCDVMRNSWLRA